MIFLLRDCRCHLLLIDGSLAERLALHVKENFNISILPMSSTRYGDPGMRDTLNRLPHHDNFLSTEDRGTIVYLGCNSMRFPSTTGDVVARAFIHTSQRRGTAPERPCGVYYFWPIGPFGSKLYSILLRVHFVFVT